MRRMIIKRTTTKRRKGKIKINIKHFKKAGKFAGFFILSSRNSKSIFQKYFYFALEKMQMKYHYFCYSFKRKIQK